VVLGGLGVSGLAAAGGERFTRGVRRLYLEGLSQHAPRFGERLASETLWLYAFLLALGAGAIVLGVLAARRGRSALALLLGGSVTPGGVALLALLAAGTLFVGLRAARDGLRARQLAGLGFEERRVRLHAENPFEADPRAVARFREMSDGEARGGNVAILRGPEAERRLRPEHLFLAAEIFPARLYLAPPPACTAAELPSDWAAARHVAWVLRDCDTAFRLAPEPFGAPPAAPAADPAPAPGPAAGIALALLLAGGLAVGLRLARAALGAAASRLALCAVGAAAGAATLGAAAFVLALAGVRLGRPLVLGLSLAVLAVGSIPRRRAPRSVAWGWPAPRSPADRWALVVLAVFAGLVAVTLVTTPLVSVDARTLWTPQARLVADTGRYPAAELRDRSFVVAHASYPPLLPLLSALVGVAGGSVDERLLRAAPTGFYFVAAVLLLAELPRREPRWGLLLATAWALMPTLVVFEEGGADAGLADVALSAFVVTSAVVVGRAGPRSLAGPALAGFLAAAAALTKNEGLVLGGLLCLSAWVSGPAGRRGAAVMTSVFVLLSAPWLAARTGLAPLLDEGYPGHLGIGRFAAGAPRAGAVLAEMLKQAFLLPHRSGLFWWLVAGWFLASTRKTGALRAGRLAIVPVYLAIVYALYVVTPWEGVVQVQLSFSRVLLQVAPLALWAVAGDGRTAPEAPAPGG
jgi:hypothetical protein